MPFLSERKWSRRGFLSGAGHATAVFAASSLPFANAPVYAATASDPTVEPELQSFIATYMRTMYSPGLSLALVRADGTIAASGFGLSDIALNQPVQPGMLFQIGSISKSFCALALLQMRDEGKLDLQKTILEYLPWLPIDAPYGTITVHHLLSHTSGLPDDAPLFYADRNARIRQGFKPGTQFHYSNTGFVILGHLAQALDKKTYAAILQTRILEPLEMKATRPAISNHIRSEEAQSYIITRDDLSSPRNAALQPAPREVHDSAAGCVASTPEDMARYMKMLLARGVGPHGRIVSEEGFALFIKPNIAAPSFGRDAHYAYGIAVDTLDGHTLLKHTGGMNSFASSMQVDLDGKVAAFASVNAMQGYRPNPVTLFAIKLLRAKAEGKPLPQPEPMADPSRIGNAADYAGQYTGAAGTVRIVAEGQSLFAIVNGSRIRLLRNAGDTFVAEDMAWQNDPWAFGREESATAGTKPAVIELFLGDKWYVTSAYTGPKAFSTPKRFAEYTGAYDSGTDGITVSIVKGELIAGGSPLVEIGDGLFRFSDEPSSPETIEFLHIVNGRAQLILLSGNPLRRVELR